MNQPHMKKAVALLFTALSSLSPLALQSVHAQATSEASKSTKEANNSSSTSKAKSLQGVGLLGNLKDASGGPSSIKLPEGTKIPLKAADIPGFAPLPPDIEKLLPSAQRLGKALKASRGLMQPDEINASLGKFKLEIYKAENKIGTDTVNLRSYNGRLVGPTIRVKAGEAIRFKLKNSLPKNPDADEHIDNGFHQLNTTNFHTHGLHVAPEKKQGDPGESDNVLLRIEPDKDEYYHIQLPKNHEAGTFWYHAHVHGSTSTQVASGMAGMLIVENDEKSLDDVPEIDAAEEQIMVFQQIPYARRDANGKLLQPDQEGGIGQIELKDILAPPAGASAEEQKEYPQVFAPGYWNSSNHHTMINGQQLPVINLRPGEVQRWRMVHSGAREELQLKIINSTKDGSETIVFHEVAVDGLPLGKIVTKNTLELYPGYRSESLVKAPGKEGTYLLIDGTRPDSDEKLKYIAKIVVSGKPVNMALPKSSELKKYRIPSVKASAVTRKDREILYGLRLNLDKIFCVQVNANGKKGAWTQFTEDNVFKFNLGEVEELVIGVDNCNADGTPLQVFHPFHIHVNPFEIIEVWKIEDGKKVSSDFDPVWRDTLVMQQGHRYRIRTRIEDFSGRFVHHCHILDHEDKGMMQLVEIVDPKKGARLFDPTPKQLQASLDKDSKTILLFSRGMTCAHCVDQLNRFVDQKKKFKELGYSLKIIVPNGQEKGDTYKSVSKLGDKNLDIFKKYKLVEKDGSVLHCTLITDSKGSIVWKNSDEDPYMDADGLLEKLSHKQTSR